MKVLLPRSCSGKEVVEAFASAALFQINDENKWNSKTSVTEFQYEPGSVKQTARTLSVEAWQRLREKRFGFFGKKIWVDGEVEFHLRGIRPTEIYKEVEVLTRDYMGGYYSDHSQVSEKIRPDFEKILERFFSILQPEIHGAPA